MVFTMTREDVHIFARKNQLAMLFLMVATDDYAGARCCISNSLLVGLVLGAQAVEKYLKAFILFKNPLENVKGKRHKISELAKTASTCCPSFSLEKYAEFIKRLEQHYETRYPDNPNASENISSSEIDELDQLVIFINEQMELPLEVKYRSYFYAMVNSSMSHSVPYPIEVWIKTNNKALIPLLPSIESKYLAIKNHLYPNTNG